MLLVYEHKYTFFFVKDKKRFSFFLFVAGGTTIRWDTRKVRSLKFTWIIGKLDVLSWPI